MTGEPLKRCSNCREEKPLGDFHRDARKPDGRKPACKACVRDSARRYAADGRAAEATRRYRERYPERAAASARDAMTRVRALRAARSPEQIAADQARLRPDGLKKCRSGHWLPLSAFSVQIHTADGLCSYCRPCAVAAVTARKLGAYAPSWDERGLYTCYLCGAPYEHADHKHPKALGGSDSPGNLAPACAACNLSKSDTPLDEFRPDLFELVSSWPCEIRLVSAA